MVRTGHKLLTQMELSTNVLVPIKVQLILKIHGQQDPQDTIISKNFTPIKLVILRLLGMDTPLKLLLIKQVKQLKHLIQPMVQKLLELLKDLPEFNSISMLDLSTLSRERDTILKCTLFTCQQRLKMDSLLQQWVFSSQ